MAQIPPGTVIYSQPGSSWNGSACTGAAAGGALGGAAAGAGLARSHSNRPARYDNRRHGRWGRCRCKCCTRQFRIMSRSAGTCLWSVSESSTCTGPKLYTPAANGVGRSQF